MKTRIIATTFAAALLASGAFAQTTTGTTASTSAKSAMSHGKTTSGSATGGSAGTASIGGTSASSVGVGATSNGANALGTGASTAGAGHSQAFSHVNPGATNGVAKGQVVDRGTFSRSMTHTRIHKGQVYSRTRTITHQPGSKPTISTSTTGSAGSTTSQ